MEETDIHGFFFGKGGEQVPAVSPEDLKKMRDYTEQVNARHPGKRVAVGASILERLLPGADIRAVSYRCMLLGMLEHLLRGVWEGGHISDGAIKAAATMEVTWMEPGKTLPFDMMQFCAAAQSEGQPAEKPTAPPRC